MVSRYQTKEPVHCFMQHCAPTHHPAHQHHGHHQHHPQHPHQAHHPAPPHLNHHPHHSHHPAQHHHQSHHHHHHQPSPNGPPPSALHAPPPLPPQQPPQSQPNPQQQPQAQQQPQLGSFRIVAAAAAAAAAAARSENYFPPNFSHQGRPLHPPPPPHHSGALGGLGSGAGAGPQGGGGGVGGGGGGGPAQAPTPPGASPHDMAKQGGGPPNQQPHMTAQPQIPGGSGLPMSYPQRASGPTTQYFRNPNHRVMTNARSQGIPPNGVTQIGFQQIPAFSVPMSTQPPPQVYMPPTPWQLQTRQTATFPFSTSAQPTVLYPPMYSYQSPQSPYIIMRSGTAGASTGGGHGGTPPQQQTLQQQSPVPLQQQPVVGAGGGPGVGIQLSGGGGGPSGHMVGGVFQTVNVSSVVNMGGNVGQPAVPSKSKPRTHAIRIVHPETGVDVVDEMLKKEEHGAASDSPARTEKEEKIAEFSSKIGKAAASSSESETPAPQLQPSETSGGGTMPQISGAINGPSENLYSIHSENVGLSQLGMNVSSEPWKQTSDKERETAVEPSICDTVIQKTVIESVAVTKPEPVKEENMPETMPVATLNPPEVQQPSTPVVSARGGGVRVASPVATTVKPTPVISPPPVIQPVEAMSTSQSVKIHSQAQPSKEIKHQVPPSKSIQTSTHKVTSGTTTVAPKGNESMVTKKILPNSREGSSERKKVSDVVLKEEEEEKTVEPIIPAPIEEPLPQRQPPQANGDESLDGKPTQRPKTKKVHKNRELNRKGAEKEGTDMDAFSDAQQQQKQEAAAAAAAAAAAVTNVNNAAAPISQRIETPSLPPIVTEKVVNEINKSRTVTPPPGNQVSPALTKTSALPTSVTPKGAANENVPVQLNSNTSSKIESHPLKVPSSKPGNEKNLDNKLSSVEKPPVPEQNFVSNANSQRDEVEKEVAVEKVTEDSVLEVPRVKVDEVNESKELTKVEKDLSSVEKIDKQEEMVAVKNSENALVSATIPPAEEKKIEGEETSNKNAQDIDSAPAAPTPVIENVAADAAISKYIQKNNYKEDQWSPLNPQGKKRYERDFLLGLQNDPQSIKKPENLPDIDIVLKDSTNRMPPRQVDLKSIAHLSSRNSQDFAPCYVKSMTQRPIPTKRNSQQGKPKGSKVVHVTIPSNSDVKLHESENAWKPRTKLTKDTAGQIKETEELNAAMRGILNKLTPQNFEKLVQQVLKLPIDTMDKLVGVINLVFDKAVDEPNFSVAYAELCNFLNNANIALQARKGEDSSNNFRKILLKRCQKEFEKDKAAEYGLHERMKEIEKEPSEDKRREMRLLMEEDERRVRRKSVGVTRFIGELYKLGMINQSIMVTCIRELLEAGDEESLECLCKLLSTVGKVLEEALEKKAASDKVPTEKKVMSDKKTGSDKRGPMMQQNLPNLNVYFIKMKDIVNERKTSSRVRFMLQDVIDLKNNKWIPRRDESNPKKIDQINLEAERESMEQSQLTVAYSQMSRGSMGGGMSRRDEKQKGEDWCTVTSKARAINIDPHKLKVSDTDSLQLGSRSQQSKWSTGATGGSLTSMSDSKKNMYTLLNEDPTNRDGGRRVSMKHKDSSQSHTKSSSTSSVNVVRSEEKERALAAVRKNVGGPQTSLENPRLRGPPSKTSSRDSSVSEENSRSTANSESQKAPAHLSQDALEKLCNMTIDDYMTSMDAKETYENMKVELPPAHFVDFIQYSVEKVLETTTPVRQSYGRLLVYLISHQLFNMQIFIKGLNKVLVCAEDMLIDVPMFWSYIADIIGVMLEEGAIPLSILKHFTRELPENLQGPLILAVLSVLHKAKGPAWISEKWAECSLHWNDLIPPKNIDKFVRDNALEYVSKSSSRGGIPVESMASQLRQLLQFSMPMDDFFIWVEANVRDKTSEPSFIRALTTAAFEIVIENAFKDQILQTTSRLLQRYINNDEKHELQCLYAIQALVLNMEHPKGVILRVFEFLHNYDLISNESFIAWEKSPDEPDGKAVALKSLTQFFTYLTEPEDDSNEEA